MPKLKKSFRLELFDQQLAAPMLTYSKEYKYRKENNLLGPNHQDLSTSSSVPSFNPTQAEIDAMTTRKHLYEALSLRLGDDQLSGLRQAKIGMLKKRLAAGNDPLKKPGGGKTHSVTSGSSVRSLLGQGGNRGTSSSIFGTNSMANKFLLPRDSTAGSTVSGSYSSSSSSGAAGMNVSGGDGLGADGSAAGSKRTITDRRDPANPTPSPPGNKQYFPFICLWAH